MSSSIEKKKSDGTSYMNNVSYVFGVDMSTVCEELFLFHVFQVHRRFLNTDSEFDHSFHHTGSTELKTFSWDLLPNEGATRCHSFHLISKEAGKVVSFESRE